ncbi:PEP-CTERM sorting domain-containing protein [Caldimonas brevitalea]|uniref:Ice-binding protein C-terminal domain-containing protein n=1 Tax=Caldimonas brevitalea TaxID=413882 RepID=A0A0G3BFM0_9BURK|nr:PEP-CTERM sorting domain-containing protein [Caldimonas brevitalea]AKJ28117.1 hypothetical protein AAW51_1426 [Caldimonas brevitalea]
MFKQAVAAAALLAALTSAQAAAPLELILDAPGAQAVGFEVVPSLEGADYSFGTLVGNAGAHVTYTYLGASTPAWNFFAASDRVLTNLANAGAPGSDIGSSIAETVTETSVLDFGFGQAGPLGEVEAVNGQIGAPFAIFGNGTDPIQTRYGSFRYVLGFDDGADSVDYNDLVIGVSAVPEPGTVTLMLAGFAACLFILRRQRKR